MIETNRPEIQYGPFQGVYQGDEIKGTAIEQCRTHEVMLSTKERGTDLLGSRGLCRARGFQGMSKIWAGGELWEGSSQDVS